MKSLIIISTIVLVALAGPLGTQLSAHDAHHPEKNAKTKKSTTTKSKQQQKKKPATKGTKSDQSETWRAAPARKA